MEAYLPETRARKKRLRRRLRVIFFILLMVIIFIGVLYFLPKTNKKVVAAQYKKKAGVWCTIKDIEICYWFDDNGVALSLAPKPEGVLLATVEDIGGFFKVRMGQRILSNSLWQNLKKIIKIQGALKFVINREKQEITAEMADGYKIFFSLTFDPTMNLKALKQANLSDIDYVDLRMKNRIYYK